jgi:hypothetical protein
VSCYLMSFGDRRLLGLPFIDQRNLWLAYSGLGSHTSRKTAFRLAYIVAAAVGVAGRYMNPAASPLHGDDGQLWEEILSFVRTSTHRLVDRYVIYFPPQPLRPRTYLYVPGGSGQSGLYAKIEYGPTSNTLENELEFLTKQESVRDYFSIPQCVGHLFEKTFRVLLLKEFPKNFSPRPFAWDSTPCLLRNKVIGVVHRKEVAKLQWWMDFVSASDNVCPSLKKKIASYCLPSHPVGLAHGDFTISNILYYGRDTMLADWEAASVEAPFMLDELAYRLALRQRQIHFDPARSFHYVCQSIIAGCHKSLVRDRLDSVLYSIAYMISRGSKEAELIGRSLTEDSFEAIYELSR